MAIIFIGMGSNEGDRLTILQEALLQLKRNLGIFMHSSSIYESEPWGFESDQPFYNAVVQFETEHLPQEVMNVLKYIENQAGRTRKSDSNYENRTLDLDLLYYDQEVINEIDLIIPHPRIHLRKFVLQPLVEIAPQWVDPIQQKSIVELLAITSDTGNVKKLDHPF